MKYSCNRNKKKIKLESTQEYSKQEHFKDKNIWCRDSVWLVSGKNKSQNEWRHLGSWVKTQQLGTGEVLGALGSEEGFTLLTHIWQHRSCAAVINVRLCR